MTHEKSSLAQYVPRFHIWFRSQYLETQMNRRQLEKAKADTGMNPLWVIAVAMAIFFAATTVIMALG